MPHKCEDLSLNLETHKKSSVIAPWEVGGGNGRIPGGLGLAGPDGPASLGFAEQHRDPAANTVGGELVL